jgi:hypothetical protein
VNFNNNQKYIEENDMNINEEVTKMDATVAQGDIVNAVKNHFADNAATSDYGDVAGTTTKAEMVAKMEGFASAIAQVNGITLHHSLVDGNVSASEFTFDFDMKDGSKVFWHEIIRRVWNIEGKVVQEEYFNAQ